MPEKLGRILDRIDSCVLKSCSLLTLWGQVVDDQVGKNTEPLKVRNQTLYVSTSSPAWAQELSYLKNQIIKKFNRLAGEEALLDIRFRANG